MIAVGLVAALAAFLLGAERVWRRAGRGRAVTGGHVAAHAAGLLVVGVAVLTPLDRLSHELLTAHMVQHLLLVLPAPILLVLARPGLPLAHLAGDRVTRPLRRLRLQPLPALALAWAVHVGVVIGWHVPALYQAALASPVVHGLEHVTMLGSAVALWAVLLRRDPRGRTAGASALAAAATGLVTGAVGVVLVFVPAVIYPWYAATAPLHGITAADDQVVAGMVMWAVGGIAYTVATCWLVWRWLARLERTGPSAGDHPGPRDPGVDGSSDENADAPGARGARGAPSPQPAGLGRRAGTGWALVLVLAAVVGGCTTRGTPTPTAAVIGEIDRGRELTLEYGCVTCHDIPGIAAQQGQAGPPLDGFARRRSIAGLLPNTPANLAAWLEDPQRIDPGNLMPDVGLDAEQAAAVAAYLSTLD